MLQTLINAFKVKDIRAKVWKMLLLLLIFRIGCYIPIPGLDSSVFSENVTGNDFLTLMNSITGGSLANGTLFALGIGPYINASIIMQLLCVGIPALERLSKQGEEGQKKIAQYTRYCTILLAVIQSIGIIVNFANQSGAVNKSLFFDSAFLAGFFMTVVYTAGAFLVMWLGERITDYGVGNGQSMIIFVGILATAGQAIIAKIVDIPNNSDAIWQLVAFVIVCAVVFFAVVYVDLSERKVPVQYAKQIKGRKMYGGQSSVIPIRISGSGVMPLIFAFSILSFPQMISGLFWPNGGFYKWWTKWMTGSSAIAGGRILYSFVLCLLI
ncbi:MAG: preprotein translocase subunit SecY, partial [Lachnospiraceae bacterium]